MKHYLITLNCAPTGQVADWHVGAGDKPVSFQNKQSNRHLMRLKLMHTSSIWLVYSC